MTRTAALGVLVPLAFAALRAAAAGLTDDGAAVVPRRSGR